MSLLAPGLQSSLLPTPTFILGSLARCHLNHFPLEPGCEHYAFLDQAVADFKQGLDSILTDSLETLELDTSLEELMLLHLLQSLLGFSTQLVPFLIILSHSFLLAFVLVTVVPGWALLAPVSLATKMSASKLIHYISSHLAAFAVWTSTPPDNISLNSANRS